LILGIVLELICGVIRTTITTVILSNHIYFAWSHGFEMIHRSGAISFIHSNR